MKNRVFWITGSCFFDVDENVLPGISKYFFIYWVIIRQKGSFYTKEQMASFMDKHKIDGYVVDLERMLSFNAIGIYLRIIKLMHQLKADLCYVNFIGLPFLFPMLFISGISKRKIVYACHDYVDHVNIKNRSWLIVYKKFIFRAFGNFHFFSRTQQSLFEHEHSKFSFYAPLALKGFGEPTAIRAKSELVTFLFFGTIRENKGLEILLKAGNRLYEQYAGKFVIRIYGGCINWSKYQSIIKHDECFDLQIRNISNDEIPNLFSSSNYLVLPYRDVTQSGPLLISYYYKLPVIASDHDGFREYVNDKQNGFLFQDGDSDNLYEVMSSIIEKRYDYDIMRKNLTLFIEQNCTLDNIINLYKKEFECIINK